VHKQRQIKTNICEGIKKPKEQIYRQRATTNAICNYSYMPTITIATDIRYKTTTGVSL